MITSTEHPDLPFVTNNKTNTASSYAYLVRDVGVYPLVLLHGVAHGYVEPGAGSGGGGAPPGHVYVRQHVRVRGTVRHGKETRASNRIVAAVRLRLKPFPRRGEGKWDEGRQC